MAETTNVIMTTDYQQIVIAGDNQSYSLQNIGKNKIEMLFSDTEPSASDQGHVLETLKIANSSWGNGTIWARVKESDGGLLSVTPFISVQDVAIQDQTTPLIIAKMSKEVAATTLATLGAIDDYSFDVVDATGFIVGQYLSIFSIPDNRFYLANVLTTVSETITVDSPLDFEFPIGSFVTVGNTNMNVDGSVTPQIYGLRNTEESIGSAFDITRIIFKCLTNGAVDLAKFGDLTALTRGIVLRKKDGTYRNVFNVKTNGELKGIMFDFDSETTVGQGQDGFTGRLTFAGQNKMGVALRLEPGEDIQLLVQDPLGGLVLFEITAEGHVVKN